MILTVALIVLSVFNIIMGVKAVIDKEENGFAYSCAAGCWLLAEVNVLLLEMKL